MTTINATEGVARVHINASQIHDSHTFIYFVESSAFAHVPTADLLAALDATANTDVAEWKARAEEAEHEVSELRGELAGAVMYDSATLTKVSEGLRAAGLKWDTITDAINQMQNRGILFRERPKPAFTLPTEAGAIIIATEVRGVKGEWVAVLDEEGDWYGPNFDDYHFHKPEHITAWKPARVVTEDAS